MIFSVVVDPRRPVAFLFIDTQTASYGNEKAVHRFTTRADAEAWAKERGFPLLDSTNKKDMS